MVKYYDYGSTSTNWEGWASSTASDDNTCTWTTSNCWYTTVIKRYLVHRPDSWDDKIHEGYIKLINVKTKTGFTVIMVIKGDVLITDPSMDTRSMKDFLPLLRTHANAEDRKLIDSFFKKHPCED